MKKILKLSIVLFSSCAFAGNPFQGTLSEINVETRSALIKYIDNNIVPEEQNYLFVYDKGIWSVLIDYKEYFTRQDGKLNKRDMIKWAIVAATVNRKELVDYFLSVGVSVNDVDSQSGRTLFIGAVEGGYIEMIKILYSKGANINYKMANGIDGLTIAVLDSNEEIVKYLVDHDVNCNAFFKNGNTLLNIAENMGNKRIVSFIRDCLVNKEASGFNHSN